MTSFSATLLVAHLLQLLYVAPESLGQHEDHLDGFTVALIALTLINFGAATAVCVIGLPVRQVSKLDLLSYMWELLMTLLPRVWRTVLFTVGLGAVIATVYGGANLPSDVREDQRGFYRWTHGTKVPISHEQYAVLVHPPLVMAAGVMTILQIVALCLTILAFNRLAYRAQGITDWPAPSDSD